MTFEEIDRLVEEAKTMQQWPQLVARQIASNSHPDPYYNFLQLLFMRTRPKGIFLEIGVYGGCVAAHCGGAAMGYTESLYVGIDINPTPYSDLNSIFLQGDSNDPAIVERVKQVADAHGGIFAVFQDSSHHYEPSVQEWENYSRLVRPGGIWISDDITPAFVSRRLKPGQPVDVFDHWEMEDVSMVDYWNQIPVPTEKKKLYDDLHIGSTIGIALL